MAKLTFGAWLRAQRGRDDVVGDLAEDAASDRHFPRSRKQEVYIARLKAMGASPEALEALRQAWQEWEASGQ
jgi:uncharacterized protein YozE (UPF0346 family)